MNSSNSNPQIWAELMKSSTRPVTPFAGLNAGLQSAMAPDPYAMAAGGAPAGGMWGQIADFLNGRARKRSYDKTGEPGAMKSWSPEDAGSGNLASSLGVYSP